MSNRETDVLIVGGSFVGLSLAAALSKSQLKVTVLDIKPAPGEVEASVASRVDDKSHLTTAANANVIAVSPASHAFLKRTGAWERLHPLHAVPYSSMYVADGEGTGEVSFSAEEEGLTCLGHIVDQSALARALFEVVAASNAEMIWQQEWSAIEKVSDGYRVILPDGEIQADLLVGADGGASPVREAVGLKTYGWEYNQRAVVAIANLEQGHRSTAWQWFTESGPMAFLPLADEHLVAVIWSTTQSEDLLLVDDARFAAAVTEASESTLGQVRGVSSRLSFPLLQRQALNYVSNHVAIIGDAAHTIHPLAGQGANLGFADAASLSTELCQAVLEGKRPGDLSLLRRYEMARRQENLALGALMEGFHRLFSAKDPITRLIRNQGMPLADEIPALKSLAVGLATGNQ